MVSFKVNKQTYEVPTTYFIWRLKVISPSLIFPRVPSSTKFILPRFLLFNCLIDQVQDAVIGNAGVLAPPHFAGAAITETLAAMVDTWMRRLASAAALIRGHQPPYR